MCPFATILFPFIIISSSLTGPPVTPSPLLLQRGEKARNRSVKEIDIAKEKEAGTGEKKIRTEELRKCKREDYSRAQGERV